MPRPVTVWEVEFGKEATPEEVKGTLELATRHLVFTPREETRPTTKIPLDEIAKVKRLRGSPVLMVIRQTPTGTARIAFYFAQPPPISALRGDATVERPSGLAAFRSPKRKARRDNIGYLGLMNRENKAALNEWVRAVNDAAAKVRNGARREGGDPTEP